MSVLPSATNPIQPDLTLEAKEPVKKPDAQKKITDFFSRKIAGSDVVSVNSHPKSGALSVEVGSSDVISLGDEVLRIGVSSVAEVAIKSCSKNSSEESEEGKVSVTEFNAIAEKHLEAFKDATEKKAPMEAPPIVHTTLSRPESEKILKPNTYLVRPSSLSGFQVFSSKTERGSVMHTLFKETGSGEIQMHNQDGSSMGKDHLYGNVQTLAVKLAIGGPAHIPVEHLSCYKNIDRNAAQNSLKPSTYLIRPSSFPEFQVISFKAANGKLENILFKETDAGKIQIYKSDKSSGGPSQLYDNIQDVVAKSALLHGCKPVDVS